MITKAGDDEFSILNNCRRLTMSDPHLDINTKQQVDFKLYRIQCYVLQTIIGDYRNGYQKDHNQKD